MIGWKKAKSPKDPHVPLKQLEKQLLDLTNIVERRAPQNAKLKGTQSQKDTYWRKKNKVPFSILQKRAGRLARIVKDRSKKPKAWNGRAAWDGVTKKEEAEALSIVERIGKGVAITQARKKAGKAAAIGITRARKKAKKKRKKTTKKKRTTKKGMVRKTARKAFKGTKQAKKAKARKKARKKSRKR